MHPISDKELDKLFQQRFGDLEIEPSAAVWEKITGTMDQKRRKAAFPSFWMAAASIVVLISAGLLYFRPQEVIKLQGSTEMAQNIEENSSRPELNEAPLTIEAPLNGPQTEKTNLPDFNMVNASEVKSSEYSLVQKVPVAGPEVKVPAAEPIVIASEPVKKVNQVQPKKSVKVPNRYSGDQSALDVTQPDMMAKADFSEDEINPEESEVRGQRKIRSIGSLVNFVIAKVDKREDKLIEFKDSDEGSEVSGINLGLVKIKGKK
ncbi:hypothetical protein [Daejeonella sp.]|uniref:hypothetical protein n=1 Tax=Daejeonella sp. TaxID=2805397 RepID=UPI00271A7707|nr:hypothetical protein [Daejeonella sp.]MDO8992580.1 hypothetical protein [Daejeonella sp.]MDP2413116.1 hypothetical protein [Daejeonella sp.]